MAREIQLSILPQETPKINGIDISARFIPMSSVAGDFYDFIRVDEKRVGILVADVSGHGLPAALIASMLQVALAAQVVHASDPGRVLAGLHQALCGKFKHHFVTAVYVFVDTEKKFMRFAGAGHPPLLLWSDSTQSASELLENGLPLGLFPDASYSIGQIHVEAGDKVVLYTDGIIETESPSQQDFGIDLFKGFLQANHDLGANSFADSLLDELSNWSEHPRGQGQKDDITILTIDFHRLEQSLTVAQQILSAEVPAPH
jgi:serine phosphatase RsbU (regulator of sigma subunit)